MGDGGFLLTCLYLFYQTTTCFFFQIVDAPQSRAGSLVETTLTVVSIKQMMFT